ncbi:MAG: hypothetical protein KGK11_13730, partial [Sphingomonadales bacterium]|nr:hypothetical protein [Sphingomonadales bacterium]
PLQVQPNRTAHVTNPTGTACFSGMDIKGTVTFDPGVYYINGGSFNAGAQANISGSGVTFILTSNNAGSNGSSVATINMNGGAQVNLTAPSSGTYSGILFYQDRRASAGVTNSVSGNSSSLLQGAIYTPKQNLQFTGNTGMNSNCLQLVAVDVTFTGNSTISNVCPSNSGTKAISGVHIRLVG